MESKRITETGYIWDKRIFWGVFVAMGLLIYGLCFQHNFDFRYQPYFVCEYNSCQNPFYIDKNNPFVSASVITPFNIGINCEWCNQAYLPRGIYGQKPINFWMFTVVILILVCLAVGLNHFLYNQGKRINIGLNQYAKYDKYLALFQDEERPKE